MSELNAKKKELVERIEEARAKNRAKPTVKSDQVIIKLRYELKVIDMALKITRSTVTKKVKPTKLKTGKKKVVKKVVKKVSKR